ncbi:MAG: response regulator [Sedimentisphaerales bacterium]|nr:response regulator [Sedimentisphaerales bacterium]
MRTLQPILLLEDDTVDAMTVKRALKDLNVANAVVRLINGEEGVKYLRKNSNVRPCVIILDLNMPKMNGIEFLKYVKEDPELRAIPVVVLTTSRADQDKFECFNNSVAGYLIKPSDYQDFVRTIQILDLYWSISEMPGCHLDKTDARIEKVLAS